MKIDEKRALFFKSVGNPDLLDQLPSSLIVTSGLDVIHINKSLKAFFEVDPKIEINHFRQIKPYVIHEDIIMLLRRIQGINREKDPSEEPNEYSVRVRTASGELKYVKNVSTTRTIEGVQFTTTSFIDISGEIRASQAITNTLNAMHVGVVLLDRHKLVFTNKRAREIFPNFPKENETFGSFLKIGLNEDQRRRLIKEVFSEHDADRVRTQSLEMNISSSEEEKWFSIRRLENVTLNQKEYYAISIEDITESKEMQYEAQRANTLFETIQEPAVIATFDGFFTKVNPAFCRLLGYSADDLMSQPYIKFIIPEDRQFTIAGNSRFLRGKPRTVNSENTYVSSSGEHIILNWIAVPDYEKKLIYATARNVSRERRYENQILESEAELKRTLRIAQLGSWSMKGLWGAETWNYETRVIFDVNSDQKDLLRSFLVEEDIQRFENRVLKCLQNSEDFDDVFKIITNKNETKFIRIIGEFQSKGEGTVKGIIQDVTTIRKAELKMIEALKMAEEAAQLKSEFLSVMSHEIRTPMNAVIGMAHLLLENDPREDQIDEIQTLQFAANNLLSLINDILDFSKAEAGKIELVKEEIDLHTFLDSLLKTFKPMAEMRSLTLNTMISEKIPEKVITDSTRLSQMLNNLIGNAIKFTESGSVSLKVELNEFIASEKKAILTMVITDTGIGIPKDKIDTIFDSFTLASAKTSRKYGGTGLGLAITKRLVDLFEGSLKVDSIEGEGTEVAIKLPMMLSDEFLQKQQFSHLESDSESLNLEQKIKTKKLLVVDDNRVNLKIVGKFLKKWEVEADYVESGYDALEKLNEGNYYHMVLMDLQMPELDGFETTRKIHQLAINENNSLPVVALTAEVMGGVRQKVQEYGMKDLIAKPFNPDKLMFKILEHSR